MPDFAAIAKALETGRSDELLALVQAALGAGATAQAILNEGLFPGMDAVGRLFREGEYFLPEVLLSARTMNRALAVLEPLLVGQQAARSEKVVLATVKGDMHDIGKTIVAILIRGAGFEVVDLGVDVPTETIVSAVREHQPVAVGLSALLTTTMLAMPDVIAALEQAGLRSQVKVLIGGAAVTEKYAAQIGADGYSDDAYGAVSILRGR